MMAGYTKSMAGYTNSLMSPSDGVRERLAARVIQRASMPVGHLELFLTEDCNHRCDYCFVKSKRSLRHMPEQTALAALDFILQEADRGSQCSIMFFGGEPLLRYDLLAQLVQYARERAESGGISSKLTFAMTTNGTLLTEDMAVFFHREGMTYLLSIDGNKETHDAHRRTVAGGSSYDLVIARFPMMKKHQPWQGARMTVHPEFAGRVRQNVEHLVEIGFNQFIVGPASGVPWSEGDLLTYERSLLEAVKWIHRMTIRGAPLRIHLLEEDLESPPHSQRDKWGCGAGRGRMSVDVDGNIYPCSKIYGVALARGATCVLGDVWHGITDYRKRALYLSEAGDLRPKCTTCEVADDCAGGCPANNLEATGSPFDPCALDCAMTRMAIRLRTELADYVRAHPMPPSRPALPGDLRHIRPIA